MPWCMCIRGLSKVFALICVDRYLFDLKLNIVYLCDGQPLPPSTISNDVDFNFFLNEISISIQTKC